MSNDNTIESFEEHYLNLASKNPDVLYVHDIFLLPETKITKTITNEYSREDMEVSQHNLDIRKIGYIFITYSFENKTFLEKLLEISPSTEFIFTEILYYSQIEEEEFEKKYKISNVVYESSYTS